MHTAVVLLISAGKEKGFKRNVALVSLLIFHLTITSEIMSTAEEMKTFLLFHEKESHPGNR